MPRSATIVVENQFTRGLITEFSAMNFPENAVTQTDNTVYSELGRAKRRLGLDAELESAPIPMIGLTLLDGARVEYKWSSVGGLGTTTFEVQQLGTYIRFFTSAEGSSLSSGVKSFFVDLSLYKTPGVTDEQVAELPVQFTSGKGFLFIVHPWCEPLSVEYDSALDTITISEILIEARDFERLEDGYAIDERRPAPITNLHKYNLFSQGWDSLTAINGEGSDGRNVYDTWEDELLSGSSLVTGYPANADIFWVYRNADAEFDFRNINKKFIGNSPAPNGHYIYPAFNIDRSAMSGIPGLPTLSADSARPSCVAFYAGRIFYAGTAADKFSDKIYFTQIIEGESQFGRCYQLNDPTSEYAFDLIDSDGGVISLPAVSQVKSLKIVGDALIVIGTNGCFAIRGSDNSQFKATDYSVEYISAMGAVADHSVVEVDASLLWVNYDAMYALSKDASTFFVVENISKQTIQTLLDNIPSVNKQYIKSAYNKKTRVVQWLYNDDEDADPWTYNKILEFNTVSKAFYTFTISTSLGPKIVGIVPISGQQINIVDEIVVDNLSVTVTAGGDPVTVESENFIPSTETFKYPTLWGPDDFTFTEFIDNDLVDFQSYNGVGVSYLSDFTSGYRIRGEMLRSFNSTPVGVVIDNFDSGRCTIQGIWDYGFRSSSQQELYVVRPEPSYLIRRMKIRGKGKSLQLRFASVGNAPFSIAGWSTFDSGGQTP